MDVIFALFLTQWGRAAVFCSLPGLGAFCSGLHWGKKEWGGGIFQGSWENQQLHGCHTPYETLPDKCLLKAFCEGISGLYPVDEKLVSR